METVSIWFGNIFPKWKQFLFHLDTVFNWFGNTLWIGIQIKWEQWRRMRVRDLKDVRPKLLTARLSFKPTISAIAILFGCRIRGKSTALKQKDISILRLENETDLEIQSKISTFHYMAQSPNHTLPTRWSRSKDTETFYISVTTASVDRLLSVRSRRIFCNLSIR